MDFIQIPLLRGVFEIEPVLDLCDEFNAYIMGGYARYACSTNSHPAPAVDVDLFPQGEESYQNIKSRLLSVGLTIRHENDMSLTFEKEAKIKPFNRCPSIQIIKPFRSQEKGTIVTVGTVAEILEQFDFTVSCIAINKDRKTATAHPSFTEDERNKHLKFITIHCPISSLTRCLKYGRKGYFLKPSEAVKLFLDWSNREEVYRDRIKDLFQASTDATMSEEEINELERMLRVD